MHPKLINPGVLGPLSGSLALKSVSMNCAAQPAGSVGENQAGVTAVRLTAPQSTSPGLKAPSPMGARGRQPTMRASSLINASPHLPPPRP